MAPAGHNTNTVQFTALTPFILTATNGLVAGPNTLDFLMNNAPGTPDVPGPTGLRVDLKLISVITPKLQLSRSGTNVNYRVVADLHRPAAQSAPTPNGTLDSGHGRGQSLHGYTGAHEHVLPRHPVSGSLVPLPDLGHASAPVRNS